MLKSAETATPLNSIIGEAASADRYPVLTFLPYAFPSAPAFSVNGVVFLQQLKHLFHDRNLLSNIFSCPSGRL